MYDSQDREERIEHSGKTLDVSLDPLHILDTLRKHGYRFKNKDRLQDAYVRWIRMYVQWISVQRNSFHRKW